jgi:hypothetical protein
MMINLSWHCNFGCFFLYVSKMRGRLLASDLNDDDDDDDASCRNISGATNLARK